MHTPLSATLAALALTLTASTALAQDDAWSSHPGAFGIGVDSAIDGPSALSLRYNLNDALGFEAMLGLNREWRNVQPADDSALVCNARGKVSLLTDYRVATSDRATLSLYGGVAFNMMAAIDRTNEVDDTYFDVIGEGGFRAELWLYDFVSIFGRAGIAVDPYTRGEYDFEQHEDGAGDDFEQLRGGNIQAFQGQFGFTFWLR